MRCFGGNLKVIKDAILQRHPQRISGPGRPRATDPQDAIGVTPRFGTNVGDGEFIQEVQKGGRDNFLTVWELPTEVSR